MRGMFKEEAAAPSLTLSSLTAESATPEAALADTANNASVTFDNADTTTNGPRTAAWGFVAALRALATIWVRRRIASASFTDVPPNFITSMISRSQQAFGLHQFRVEQRGAGGAAYGVVAQGDELVSEHGAHAQAADGHGHSVAAI